MEVVGQAAGFSRGYLSQLLRGRQDLKLQHVERVLVALEFDAVPFLRRVLESLWESKGFPASKAYESPLPTAGFQLASVSEEIYERGPRDQSMLANAEAGGQQALKDTIREIVRQELVRQTPVGGWKKRGDLVCPTCGEAITSHGPAFEPSTGRDPLKRIGQRLGLDEPQLRADLRVARSWVREIVRLDPGKRLGRIRGAYHRFRGPVFGTLLLEEARRAIPADPAESLSLAEAALVSCEQSNQDRPDPEIRAAALAVAGNAKRALGRLKEAEEDLAKARELLDTPGMRDPVLPAEVESYLGSLRKNQGRLDEAACHLERASDLYAWLGQREDAARVLLQLGNVHYRAHRIDAAIEAVDGVLDLLAAEAEGWLQVAAHFNRADFLHARGDLDEAEKELEAHAGLLAEEGVWGRQHLAWLRARIAWSREDLKAAERLYTETRDLTLERGIPFDTSLVNLELCLVYLAQGRTARVKKLATEALEVFAEQEVEREVRAALALVVEAARREALTRELVERAIAALERARQGAPRRTGS